MFASGVTAATSAARGPWLGAGAPTCSANGVGEETPASTLCSGVVVAVSEALGVAEGVGLAGGVAREVGVAASVAWTVGRGVGRRVAWGVGVAVAGAASTADWIQ
jgi:hypothetical protein